jgi:DnaJ-domain-containing protein 1
MSEALKRRLKAIEGRIPKRPFPDPMELSDEEAIDKILRELSDEELDAQIREALTKLGIVPSDDQSEFLAQLRALVYGEPLPTLAKAVDAREEVTHE